VWIAAYPFGAAGNDIRWILRFDIGSLSDVE
jgi:hypothetical protein